MPENLSSQSLSTQPLGANPQQVAPKTSGVPKIPKKKFSFVQTKLFWTAIFILFVLLPAIIFIYSRFFTSYVDVPDQTATDSIYIKKLHLTTPGLLAITAANDYGKPGGRGIAASELLKPETYTDFRLRIADEVEIRPKPGDILFATLHEDTNQSGIFENDIDQPLKNLFGKPIVHKFRIK